MSLVDRFFARVRSGARRPPGAPAEVEDRLRRLIAASPAVIYRIESAGLYSISYIGECIASQLGYSPHEFTEDPGFWADRVHPEDAPGVFAELARIPEDGYKVHEYRLRHKNGTYRWIRDELRLVRSSAGAPLEIEGFWVDITDRKQAEQKLVQVTSDLQAIFRASPDLYFWLDPDGRILDYQAGRFSDLYLPPAQFLGKRMQEILPPSVGSQLHAALVKVLETNSLISVEYPLQTLGGDQIFEARVFPILEKQVLVMVRNITERRRAEEDLRESEERYRIVAETATDPILTIDEDGKILFVSRAGQKVFGYTASEILGRDVSVLMPGYLGHRQSSALKQEGGAGQKRSAQEAVKLTGLHRSGREIPLEVSFGEFVKDGKRCVTGIVRDISERIESERRLQERTTYLDALVQNSPLGIVSVDSRGCVQMCNAAFQRLFQYRPEEIAGANIDAALALEGGLPEAREFTQKVLGGETVHATTRRKRRDGTPVDVELHAVPLRVRGELVGAYGLYEDITERRELEEHLRQAQKMEAVGKLAGGVAHDFNNLLTAIAGYCELTLMRLGEDPLRRNIEEIQKATERAAALTQQLLAFSRKQVLAPRILDPTAIVARMEGMLKRLIGEDIELATPPGPGTGRIKADQGQIEQVILNLALNARDAMPQGGRLVIETANVDLDDAYARRHAGVNPGPYVMLSVSDSGSGMDGETQRHIFEPYFTTKEQGKGTGLGLSTVYGIIAQSGGNIWVYSEPGEGTSFKIYLPRVEEGASTSEAPAPPAGRPVGTETILLVEDDGLVREVARQTLEISGYTVLPAQDGEDAVLVAGRHPGSIHLMVTDVVMPRMSGRELVERLGPLRPEMKVLYVSGYTEDAIVQHGMVNLEMAFLQKPFALDALARKVREVLDAPGYEPR